MASERIRYEGGYVRGGARTLYMTRADVIETIAYVLRTKGDLRTMTKEAKEMNKARAEEAARILLGARK